MAELYEVCELTMDLSLRLASQSHLLWNVWRNFELDLQTVSHCYC